MPEMQWWYARGEQQFGPVSPAELRRLASAGDLSAGDLVWREGLAEWAPASRLKGLFPEAPPAPRDGTVSSATANPAAASPATTSPAAANSATTSPATTNLAAISPPTTKPGLGTDRPAAEKAAPDKPAAEPPAAEPAPGEASRGVATQETAELGDRPPSDPNLEGFTLVQQPAGVPPVELPPPPPSASDSGQIMPASSPAGPTAAQLRQRVSLARLTRILTTVQISLWVTCVLVVLLGGTVLAWSRLHNHNSEHEATSAVVYGMFFIGAYVVARAGQEISRLVLARLEKRRS